VRWSESLEEFNVLLNWLTTIKNFSSDSLKILVEPVEFILDLIS